MPPIPKSSSQGLIVALAILLAAGMLALYFRIELLSNDLKILAVMSDKKISASEQNVKSPEATASYKEVLMTDPTSSVTLKKGETVSLLIPTDASNPNYFSLVNIETENAKGPSAILTSSLWLGDSNVRIARFNTVDQDLVLGFMTVTLDRIDETSATFSFTLHRD